MRILFLTQYYPPEIGAPQNRLSELAQGLAKSGHVVTVLTAMPSYPFGRIFPGYGGMLRNERLNGVNIIRTFIYPTQSTAFVKRLTNYITFALSSILIGGWFVGRQDYVLTESPPLFLGISGYLLSRWKRARWIFNVSDLWPGSAVHLGLLKPGMVLRLSESLEAFCYRRAWLVTGQSSTIIDEVIRRFSDVRAYHLSNGVDTQRFRPDCGTPQARSMLAIGRECVVLYAGLHGLAQGLEQIIEAATRLSEEPGIRFVLLGDGPEKRKLLRMARERRLANIRFLNPVPQEDMPNLIAAADIMVIPLKTYILGAVPSKLYEAMACGLPLIVIASGDAADIVSKHEVGLIVPPGDVAGLVSALRCLAQDPHKRKKLGQNGRQVAVAQYNRSVIVNQFMKYLEEQS
jgi:glycosyltransferase involved in cell wall biosynthesis